MFGSNEKGHVHIMGITGSGASATAGIARYQGFSVSGCDISAHSEYRKELDDLEVPIATFHNPSHLEGAQYLVVSPAILHADPENQEIRQAKQRGIPVMTWQEFSGTVLQQDKYVIGVSGTHGKSTTTAMIALIMEAAGLDPTVQLGAIVPEWGKNYRVGKSKYFVIEADEYNNNFLHYTPTVGAITNVEYDHPEHFRDEVSYRQAFQHFAEKIKDNGVLFVGRQVASIIHSPVSKIVDVPSTIQLKLIGDFNKENAGMAEAIARQLKIDQAVIKQSLEGFSGLARRFSLAGESNGIKVYDDYAHHPTAVFQTCKAARQKFPNQKIWVIFQPHMFTRTQMLLNDFVEALNSAPVDTIIIADIYASREYDTGKISAQDVVSAVNKASVIYAGNVTEVELYIKTNAKPGDIIINMGAGDIPLLSQNLLKILQVK